MEMNGGGTRGAEGGGPADGTALISADWEALLFERFIMEIVREERGRSGELGANKWVRWAGSQEGYDNMGVDYWGLGKTP